MEEYELAIILTAVFTGISMLGIWFRASIAYKDYKLKKKNKL